VRSETIIIRDNRSMDLEDIRRLCLRLPHVTEQVQWGDNLVFKVGGKMFLVAPLEASKHALSLKVSLETFDQLQEVEGIVPAPYLARARWFAMQKLNLLPEQELRALICNAHALILESLPRARRVALDASIPAPRAAKIKPVRAAKLHSPSPGKLD
jgi:predicted DNA-binding protein (MmcQ/YjbR family)